MDGFNVVVAITSIIADIIRFLQPETPAEFAMPTDIQEQIERRRERAREEILKIANKGSHPVFSQFEVKSVSGWSYRVEIRSLDEMHNSCTCPDYKTNLIGTCKHIEGVLIYLKEEHGDRLEKLAAERPRGTQIYLHYGAEVTVRVTLPLPDRAPIQELLNRCFDPSGLLVGSPLQTLPPLLAAIESLPARERLLISVAEAVREYLALLQDREEVQQQKEWFLDQVEREDAAIGVFITLEPPTRDMTQEAIACSPDSSTVGRTRVSYPQSIYP